MSVQNSTEVRVWDPFVRVAHWTIAIAFIVAYLTEDDSMTVHVWAGYVIGILVLLRVIWGFFGPRHARFTDFVCGPIPALAYLRDLFLFRAKRHVGHSPAGGAMVIALLLFLAATVASGLVLYAEDRGAGPLAPFLAQAPSASVPPPDGARSTQLKEGERRMRRESALEEIHEALANVTLVLVIIHIMGVILASFIHHENLTRSMVTGRKRRD
ncbi:MAG: cytochrome b/b6 domain-containing protein [Methylibium sp.]